MAEARNERNNRAQMKSILTNDYERKCQQIEMVESLCKALIQAIEHDERHKAPPANVQINAPLALIQVSLKSRLIVAQEILDLLEASND